MLVTLDEEIIRKARELTGETDDRKAIEEVLRRFIALRKGQAAAGPVCDPDGDGLDKLALASMAARAGDSEHG